MTIEMSNKILLIGDHPHKSGKIYPRDVILSICENQQPEYKGSYINVDFSNDPQKVAIIVKNMRVESNILLCDFTIQDTIYGVLLQKFIREQPFMLSPHGVGYINTEGVVYDYTLQHINVELT